MYRVGIIGTGRIGFLLENDPLRIKPCTHAGGIIKNRKLKIVAACDINKKRLNLFGKKYNVSRLYTDYHRMFENEKLDVVVIATWTDTHKEITIESAKKGVKVIVCEKPMAFTVKDCQAMLNVCRKYNSILLINHERRYDPMYRKVKEMIDRKIIGDTRTVIANVLTCSASKIKSFVIDRSSLFHDGTHLIDIALFLFGKPKNVKGIIPSRRRDTVYGIIEFSDNIFLFLEAGGDREYFNFELDIQGTRGRIRVGNEYLELWKQKKSPRYTGFFELEKYSFPRFQNKNQFIEEYREVIELIEGKKRIPTSSGKDGMESIKIIQRLITGS